MGELSAQFFSESLGRIAELISEEPMERLDADMRHLVDLQAGLGARPLELATPRMARRQPSLEDAARQVLARQARPGEDGGMSIEERSLPGPEGELPARVYRALRREDSGPAPLILYLHDGLWVTGNVDRAEAVPRMLARRTGAVVLAVGYRQAPEHRFPAAHEDAWAGWRWMLETADDLGGDRRRTAIVGEGSGGNLALNIALRARASDTTSPLHLVLVSPIAGGGDFRRPSYAETVKARPLGAAGVHWSARHAFEEREQMADPRIDLAGRDDLGGLPPVTLILAEVDPLRSEGEALGEALAAAGTSVETTIYEGVTNGFFALGTLVNKAMFAQSQATTALNAAFILGRIPRR